MNSNPPYHRVMLKLGGELFGKDSVGIEYSAYKKMAEEIIDVVSSVPVQLAITVGAGNIFRGRNFDKKDFDEAVADSMGMLATILNALALQEVLEKMGAKTRMMTSLSIPSVAEPFIRRRALRHLEKGRIVIFGGGTGNPFFTTDSAAALRASEINCDLLMKATNVDGVYDKDPKKFDDAKLFREVSYEKALQKGLQVMDNTAFALCQNKNIPIVVFNVNKLNAIKDIIQGKKIGTLVRP